MALSEDQVRRYARHILLPDVGGKGQERLLAGRVPVEVGPGRDAEVAALAYLAAAGVGHLDLVGASSDPVTAADVAGGILYGQTDVGRPRIDALRARLRGINPDVSVEAAPATDAALRVPPQDTVAEALSAGCAAAVQALAAIARAP